MLRRLTSLRDRYVLANMVLHGDTGPLADSGGTLTRVTWERGRLLVEGQCDARHLTLRLGAMAETAPGGGPFALSLPWPSDIPLDGEGAGLFCGDRKLAQITFSNARAERQKQAAQFWKCLFKLLPTIAAWFVTRDQKHRSRIKRRLSLDPAQPDGPLPTDLFATGDETPLPDPQTPITIVLPVYNATHLLAECLERVSRNTDLPWRMILIDDGSTDADVRPVLRDWVDQQDAERCTLILRDENRGFVQTVNEALAIWRGLPGAMNSPVVLLNSDAMVPPNWASRLLRPLRIDTNVASVTPMSNDAEIFSTPGICARIDLAPGQGDAIDATTARFAPGRKVAVTPTGVGFCMAMAPAFLSRVPEFDTSFGRGYGEEVDWCQRVRAVGGRHLGTAGLFVEHKGGASFGSNEKGALIAKNNAEISRRYPRYAFEVQEFIATDPLRAQRLALATAWAGSQPQAKDGVPIYLAHSMGGGAEKWLEAQLDKRAASGLASVILRVGGPERWQLTVHGPSGGSTGWCRDFALVQELLAPIKTRRIVYSCGVGDRDPVTLPDHLLQLKQGPGDKIEMLLHDYFPISPSFTLLDSSGRFTGPVTPDTLPRTDDHSTRRPDGQLVSLADWQAAWGTLVMGADTIRVFSSASANLFLAAWPDARDRVELRPHSVNTALRPVQPTPGKERVLGVLGNIAPHKGAALVQALARMNAEARGGKMVLIGDIDPHFPLPRGFAVHGAYRPADIPKLAEHYGVTHWLIPSVWPETFSFTTHEALATGLPVLAFDMGAQGDAVRAAGNGRPLPYAPDADLPATVVRAFSG